MKDFKNYQNNTEGGTTPPPEVENTVNLATMLITALNGKSMGDILKLIISEAERGKRDGTLTNADLDNFYITLAPMLDGFKRKKLQEVITKLKAL